MIVKEIDMNILESATPRINLYAECIYSLCRLLKIDSLILNE